MVAFAFALMVSPGLAHTPATHSVVVHAVPCVHPLPLALHVSGTLPLHCVAPGVQAPVQTPPLHVEVHCWMASHAVPVELHSSTTLPSQRCVCAVHVVAVVHALFEHPCEHTCCVAHICDALQTCSTLPLHCRDPVVHVVDVHAVPMQV
jgi:hypothetical protein